MEYIVGIAVIAAIVYLLTRKKEEAVVEAQPETKVEAVNAQPVAEVKQAVKAAPKAKAPAAAKKPAAAPKAPAAKKAPAKKPVARKPKA
jgi:hypothetical protein